MGGAGGAGGASDASDANDVIKCARTMMAEQELINKLGTYLDIEPIEQFGKMGEGKCWKKIVFDLYGEG